MDDIELVILIILTWFVIIGGFIWQGLQIQDIKDHYVKCDEVEQMVYDILAKRQNRDEQVQWAQLQRLMCLHLERHPEDTLWLGTYRAYWEAKALERWLDWETE